MQVNNSCGLIMQYKKSSAGSATPASTAPSRRCDRSRRWRRARWWRWSRRGRFGNGMFRLRWPSLRGWARGWRANPAGWRVITRPPIPGIGVTHADIHRAAGMHVTGTRATGEDKHDASSHHGTGSARHPDCPAWPVHRADAASPECNQLTMPSTPPRGSAITARFLSSKSGRGSTTTRPPAARTFLSVPSISSTRT